jgi:hypothetical protein
MLTTLTAARKSTRRYNSATDTQRRVWRSHFRTLLVAAGLSEADASYEAQVGDAWDGMATPRIAVRDYLAARAV